MKIVRNIMVTITILVSTSSFGEIYFVNSQNLRFETADGLGYCNGIKVIDQNEIIFGLGHWQGCTWDGNLKGVDDFTDFGIDTIQKITNELNRVVKLLPTNSKLYLIPLDWDENNFFEFMIPEVFMGGPPNGSPFVIDRSNRK